MMYPDFSPPKWIHAAYPGNPSRIETGLRLLPSSRLPSFPAPVALPTPRQTALARSRSNSGNKIANLTFYDLKSAWTQAKNYALNISEIEAKVNEATSDDPWGASSTLMQEIAAATHNFQDFNEIMPCIFRNFMEKEAREWRQIYKVSQSARAHMC